MKRIAVVILNYNGAEMLRRFLPNVLENSPEANVYVADNGSTDNSVETMKWEFPQVPLILFDKNHGFAEGYNLAIGKVEEEYALLLNSDVKVSPRWLQPLIDYMDANADVAACQPKILSYRNMSYFEYAGAAGGFMDKWGYPYCRGRIFGTVEKDEGQYNSISDVFWATGAALMVRREIYIDNGGLDSRFFAHMEEIDFCWRLRSRGMRIVCIPQSYVFHIGGATLKTTNPKKVYLNFRNNLLMLYKNLPKNEGRRILIIRRLLDTIALARYIAGGEWQHARAVWLAHNHFRKERKRYHEQPDTNILKETPEGRRNIVIDYFIRRKHTYRP